MKLRVGLYIDVDEISQRATAICSTQHCIKRMAGKRMAKSLKAPFRQRADKAARRQGAYPRGAESR
jgi:hypothetical protein